MHHLSKRWLVGATALVAGWGLWAACTGSDGTTGGLSGGGTGGSAGASAGSSGAGGTTAGAGGASGANGGAAGSGGNAAGSGGSTAGASGAGGAGAGTGGAAGVGGAGGAGGNTVDTSASVLQYHKSASRDGVYADAAFTKTAAAMIHPDTTFNATMAGPTYAQPLYFEGGPGGKDLLIVATEQNQVTAFSATDGSVVWQKTSTDIGQPSSNLPCGNIKPLGITGTPAIDAASRTLYFDAMTGGSGTPKHLIYALSIDDGSVKAGWPVDVSAKVKAGNLAFTSNVQGERGALLIANNMLYVPYGGHWGDCGSYHGWVVGVPLDNPGAPIGWATGATKGGIWSMGGVVSDGTSVYVATGNTSGASTWGQGEAIIRFPANLAFSGDGKDYWAPSEWQALDGSDTDIGGSNPILFHVAGATPSDLIVGLGKDGNAYLVGRDNMNGMMGPVATKAVSSQAIINGPVAYTTSQGTYVAFKGRGMGCPNGMSGGLTALKIGAASPPTINVAWCVGAAAARPW